VTAPTTHPEASGPDTPAAAGDPTVSYANERTFLAWVRTSLGLMTAGLAITQLLPEFSIAGGRRSIGLPLIALGVWTTLGAYRRWELNERAIQAGLPVPPTRLATFVAFGVAVIAAVALALAAFGPSAKFLPHLARRPVLNVATQRRASPVSSSSSRFTGAPSRRSQSASPSHGANSQTARCNRRSGLCS
jgi:putative membrane protein